MLQGLFEQATVCAVGEIDSYRWWSCSGEATCKQSLSAHALCTNRDSMQKWTLKYTSAVVRAAEIFVDALVRKRKMAGETAASNKSCRKLGGDWAIDGLGAAPVQVTK